MSTRILFSAAAVCVSGWQMSHAATTQTQTPQITSRGDSLGAGDRLILRQDSPIFEPATYPNIKATTDKPTCLPRGSKLTIIDPGTVETKTSTEPDGAGTKTVTSQQNGQATT
jgi:hypothetical protein